ncbi:tetratricopeptide repeat protein [Neptuniibacter sp. QD34_54]|uniref:tetratricopeptide repeat protein n=1 Tax=Neptuniibacter sp. QD34_54 TaxID=3398208 RepID=UPI0039F5F35C
MRLVLAAFLALFPLYVMAFDFTCAREADYLPEVDPEAQELFMQTRRAEVKRGKKDHANITGLYELAADKGHWKAMHNLFLRYLKGKGTPRDSGKAIKLNQKLVDMNVPIGYYNMAVLLEKGHGVIGSDKDSAQYLLKAASMGEPNALIRLGNFYGFQLPLEKQQDDKASAYYKCAAKQDVTIGYYEYARWLKIGEENYPKSAYYYLLAFLGGHYGSGVVISSVFEGGTGGLGYEENEKYSSQLSALLPSFSKDPLYRIPNIAELYPLPYHPTMGRYNPETDQNEMPE